MHQTGCLPSPRLQAVTPRVLQADGAPPTRTEFLEGIVRLASEVYPNAEAADALDEMGSRLALSLPAEASHDANDFRRARCYCECVCPLPSPHAFAHSARLTLEGCLPSLTA